MEGNLARLAYIRGVTTIELDPTKCNGCRMCMRVCPHPVFGPLKGSVEILEPDLCIECGACVMNCSERALSVQPGSRLRLSNSQELDHALRLNLLLRSTLGPLNHN